MVASSVGRMASGYHENRFVRAVNGVAVSLINAPVLGNLVGQGLVVVRYTGRRSGNTFEIPVGYRRRGNVVTINVAAPNGKSWWRNFLGAGGELTLLNFHGADCTGHATATRDPKGRVKVTVQL
ncbi:hypothetical protein MNAB215_3748 [Mycobacterium numidiamassiliense]|uniref:Nitroreductase n=2 Tax=Mycobacterium numidiamassiliense TaxID=1841861 RepID=A0A2U3PCR0_9MYCO|nr:hypothetical protein MNAB215_3748 [Mycobacterium numidiamassiliense]